MSTWNETLTLLDAGDWEAAHRIVQRDESVAGSWAHGIVHLMEGDRANAAYWYRRAGRRLPDDVTVRNEIVALRRSVTQSD